MSIDENIKIARDNKGLQEVLEVMIAAVAKDVEQNKEKN